MFYTEGISWIAEIVWEIFIFIPSFNFTLAYGQIARIAGDHLESSSMLWADGRDFTMADLFAPTEGIVAITKKYRVPSIAY